MIKKSYYLILFAAAGILFASLLHAQNSYARAEGTATRTPYPTRTRTSTGLPTQTRTTTPTSSPTVTSTASPTPAGLYAWVEPDLDLHKYPPAAPFILHFSSPVDPASAGGQPALLTFPWVEGTTSWDEAFSTLTFRPESPLIQGDQYLVFINQDLKDGFGQALNGTRTWVLKVGSGPKVTVPQNVPAGISRRPVTRLSFNRPMDADSVAAALSIQPAVPFELGWKDNVLSITCTQVLTPGLQLIYTLDRSATDTSGTPLGENYTWRYKLAPFTALASSTVTGMDERVIGIAFNYPVDYATLGNTISITPTLSGARKWSENMLRVTPQDAQDAWSLYEISFNGLLKDPDGNPLPALDPIQFVPPVPVSTERCAECYVNLDDIYAPIVVPFMIPVDHASVEAAFRIEPDVEGTFTWHGKELSFQPSQPLEWGKRYTVSILPDARNASGRPFLASAFTREFIVSLNWSDTSFGDWGANIQVVDAQGSRAIQFQNTKATELDFVLYQFDLPTFIELYQGYFRVESTWNTYPTIPTSGGIKVAAWPLTPQQVHERAIIPEVYLPQEIGAGFYLLEMFRDGSRVDQLFVVLTRNTLVVKKSGEELLAWVSDINGESIPAIEVRLYSRRGEKIRVGQADSTGIFRTTIPPGYDPLLVVARTPDGDFTVSGLEGIWGPYSYYGWWYRRPASASRPVYAYVYTDRPIYRPGQTVYFKVIARAEQDVKYRLLPAGTPVTVSVLDARDNLLQTIELETNAFGSVNGEFLLPDGAMLGTYRLKAVVNEHSFSQVFKVQEYRKPDIQVNISTDAAQYVTGDKMTISVDAYYYFGKPVANANVKIQRYRLLSMNYYWYECTPGKEQSYVWYSEYGVDYRLNGRTDANGYFTTETKAKYQSGYDYFDEDSWYSNLDVRTVGLEVTLDDGSGQTVSNFTVFKVYNTDEKLKLTMNSSLQKPGQPFQVTATDFAITGEPVAGKQLTFELRYWNRDKYSFTDILTSTVITTNVAGQAVASLTAAETGYYQLRLHGKDSRGNITQYNRYLYVYQPGDTWANASTRDELSISVDQAEAKPYQTVHLTIESTFSGPAMLTFERGRVNRVRPIQLTAPLTELDVEIIPEDAPNIYITVNAWQKVDPYPPGGKDVGWSDYHWYLERSQADSILRTASVEVSVEVADKALNIAIQSDQEVYAPRQSATFTVTVTDFQNRAVEAELSLALVDEAIYALSGELNAPVLQAFYGPRKNSVSTYNTYGPYRIIRDNSGGGGGGGDEPGNPRADFPDTAIWIPALATDPNGVVTLTLDLPDTLTSWRVIVLAVTKNTLVGQASFNILTQRPVVVRPQLPVGLVTGDQVTLAAFVHNYSDTSLDLVAAIQVPETSLAISGTLTQSLTLAAGEVKLVGWTADALEAGEALITISAFPSGPSPAPSYQGEFSDAVQLSVPIVPLAIPALGVQSGSFQGAFDTIIPLPEATLSLSTVRLELSLSVAGELLTGLEYLTGYPYGCVEQTMSRALPNAAVARAFQQLGTSDQGLTEAIGPLIRSGLARLYGYQHNDGGWGWWYDDETNDYQTAWVVFGLAMTQEAGYPVEPKVIERGASWLKKYLDEMDIRTQAYALYSMAVAGYGDLAAVEALDAASRAELDPFSLAALALAYHKLGAEAQARAVLVTLSAAAFQQSGLVFWSQNLSDGEYDRKTMVSTTRSTALALEAFVQIDPQHKLVAGAVEWLMSRRRPNGWGNTNETSYTILALTDYMLSTRNATDPVQVVVELDGAVWLTATLDAQNPRQVIDLPVERLKTGANHLQLRQVSSEMTIYYRLTQRLVLPQPEIPAAGEVQIQREYLNPNTKARIKVITPGQLVLVRLTVTVPEDSTYMILEDHLPGGLEALNEKLNYTGHVTLCCRDTNNDEGFYWRSYGYNYKEIRGSAVSFFVSRMPAGKNVYTYLARATRPGEFLALPAEAYAMYDEKLWGRSSSSRVTITAK